MGWIPPRTPVTQEGVLQKLLRQYGNFYGELSDAFTALDRDHDYGPKFLTEFQDRLFFGTDFCCVGMPFRTQELLLDWRAKGKISEEVFQKIARENARKYFQL